MLVKTVTQDSSNGTTSFEYVRIDNGDVYSMDVTLARIVHPMLKLILRDKNGVPSEFTPNPFGPQYEFDFYHEDECTELALKVAEAKWTAMLEKMVYAFGEIANGRYLGSDHKMTVREREAYYERIQEGLNLFGEHYFSLWT